MTDQPADIRRRLQQTHVASHRTAGTEVSERVSRAELSSTPSDEEIRLKAYECWEARGRVHGRDKEDWFEALEALRRPALPDGAPIAEAGETSSDLLSSSIRAANSMLLGAAHMLDGLLGLSESKNDDR